MTLDTNKLALAGGLTAALCMLLLSLGYALNLYQAAAMQMQSWHMFYGFTPAGTLAGMIEAFIWTYIGLYVFGRLYNWLVEKK